MKQGPAMTTKTLLLAAIASVVVYGLGDLASGMLYDGYSYRDQWISELSAFGSPVRSLMVTAILVHGLLLIAFAIGVWRFADRKSLRWVGPLLIVAGVIGLPTHTVFAMSSRWMTGGLNDTVHAALSLAFGLVVFVAVALSAVACRMVSALRNRHHSDPRWVRSCLVGGHSRDRTELHTLGWGLRAHQRLLLLCLAGRAGRDRTAVARSERHRSAR